MNVRDTITNALIVAAFSLPFVFCAKAGAQKVEVAVTYVAQRSLKANTSQNFWMQGGSIELGTNIWKGLGVVADVTGSRSGSIGNSGIPLSMVTTTFGPRYRFPAAKKMSIYVQGLVGEANAFDSLFPAVAGATTSSNSFAAQVGGGLDLRVSKRFSVRALDAAWLRTQFPNSTDNVQNTLRLGAGVVIHLGH